MNCGEKRVVTILGCTASGKGELARRLALVLDAEIVSLDSMKIYRGMDIGTNKPSHSERAATPHHLIDVADVWESFSAARYVELADAAINSIHERGRPALLVGGTMLYFRCLHEGIFTGPSADADIRARIRRRISTEGSDRLHAELASIDPAAAAKIHPQDHRRIERALEVFELTGIPISRLQAQWDRSALRRPDWSWRIIGLSRQREAANKRINERVRRMIASGLVDEARRLWSDPRGLGAQARAAVGYAELYDHFEGQTSLEEAVERIKINSRRLAKSQRTWLKRVADISWFDPDTTSADAIVSGIHELSTP